MKEIVVGRRKEDLEEFGTKGTGYIGKHIVGEGEEAHLTNPVILDLLRPHVILVTGKRGCILGEHLIFTENGYKCIKEFKKDEKVLSLNLENLSFEWKNAKLVKYEIDDKEELLKFILEDHREIVVTYEHPLLVFHNDIVLLWKKASQIKEGEKLVITNYLPEVKNDKESPRIAELLGFILADGTINIRKGRFKDGRGYWYNGTKKRIRITTSSEKILNRVKKDFLNEFGIWPTIYKRKSENCFDVTVTNGEVVDKFIKWGVIPGKKAKKIRIPKIVWESSNEFKLNFLRALFSCDGYVQKNGGRVEYYTASEAFAKELQLLLTHFCIESVIREKKTMYGKYFKIGFSDYTSLINFREKIGFFQDEKNSRLKKKKFWRRKRKVKTIYLNDNLACKKIIKIEKIKNVKEVFDLVVDDNHSFISNGIISHNSGKSYTAGVMMEEIALLPEEFRKNLTVVMIDTMGIYWSSKFPNEQQIVLLDEWGLKPKGLKERVKVYVPFEEKPEFEKAGIPVDFGISIPPHEFSGEDWSLAFNLPMTNPLAIGLQKNVNNLRERNEKFSMDDLISKIKDDIGLDTHTKSGLENMLTVANQWGVFGNVGVRIEEIMKSGKINVFDVSRLRATEAWSVRNLLVAMIARKIYDYRVLARKQEELAKMGEIELKEKKPMVWLMIDEAHQFIGDIKTVSTNPLLTIVKQGREPGISFVPMTQMPNKVHQDVISQCDMVISHRLTSKNDLDALSAVMQTYMKEEMWNYINSLPKWIGSGIILDDNSERIYTLQVRPRLSWHAGEAAIAVTK